MAKNLHDLSLQDILPSSIRDDYQVYAAAKALDPELQGVSRDIREALILSRIDELPEAVIDLLAWQWHVDFYELARTLEMKRKAVKGSIRWHRKKGTVWAIRQALAMLGIESEIVEWWKIEGAAPYTFGVKAEITSGFWSKHPDAKDATKAIRRAIMESKSTRSWLIRLETVIRIDMQQRLYHGIATLAGGRQSLYPELPSMGAEVITGGTATFESGRKIIGTSLPEMGSAGIYAGVLALSVNFITIGAAEGG